MDKLIDYLMDFIPKNAQVPYFIDGYPLDDEEDLETFRKIIEKALDLLKIHL